MGTIIGRRLGALAVAVMCCVAAGRGASQATVDELIAKNLEARGGLKRLRGILSIKQTAQLSMMGTEASMTIYSKRPNLVRQETKVAGQLVINGFDGVTPWIVNPLIGPPRPIVVSGPQAEMIRQQSEFDGPLVDYKGRGLTITAEGVETFGDLATIHLRVVSPTKQVRNLFLDSTTFLEARLTTEQDKMKLDQDFSDYRDVDGVKVPFLVRTSTNGVMQSELKVQTVEFNVKMDDTMFRMPKGS